MSDFIKSIEAELITWRRLFHQYPELGFMEYITTYRLGKELEKLGFTIHLGEEALDHDARLGIPNEADLNEHELLAKAEGVEASWLAKMSGGLTGLVATWDTGRPGDHVAFRFDIDALPITETKDTNHIPAKEGFLSTTEQTMHACGHDGHMTIGLGVATFIATHQSSLKGKFTLLFQPAEEGGRGAKAMTEKGWLDDVDYFYSGHIGIQSLPIGTVAATTEGFLASSKLNVTFTGVSSHAGMHPELGRNALLAAAVTATNLYAIPRHSDGITRINVGKMVAGSGRNIIPSDAYLEIETRGETRQVNDYMLAEATRIIKASADMYDVSYEITPVGITEEMVCSETLIPKITKACQSSDYVKEVLPIAKVSGSEDASFMMNRVQQHGGKATYMLFGTELKYPHHHPSFDFQENVLAVALDTFIKIIEGGSQNE
ncbi:amidohydrolase [Oceanobacillus polygoni]|uniref:Aminobenzoyl-glutamate utilization protein A n=1 Tax=Oceanobacillus polygoni TaxID=1235259 RepID=A0A9X0YXX9_9BACI|nr:amidohydrolase [Oceanobacillus polygoni]MBP2078841.1 aminobenzoyl-glutamate utilization protein A [Oceanobacillus polygoni]